MLIKRRRTYTSVGDCTNYEKGPIRADCKVSNVESEHFLIVLEKRDVGLGSWFPKTLGISSYAVRLLVPQSSVFSGLVKKTPEVCDRQ